MAFVEKTAKTVEEAVAAALKELNITAEEAVIEVLEEGKKGFFGMFSKDAKVRVTAKEVVVEELSKDDGRVVIKEFLIFDVGTQKSRVMAMYEDRRTTPDYLVPKVKLAKELKEALKREGTL